VDNRYKRKAVATWLLIGVAMIVVQILLGGITRLTGSGLSITEWKPIMGALPPLNEKEWNEAFAGYKQIAQYKYLNQHFELSDFKFIFFWEWLHRLWARLLGVVFIIGFVYFLVKQYFDKEMIIPFVILFLLGALQGFIGWIMVASGLNENDLYVNHIKLALHFIAALILLCYTLWFAFQLLIPKGAIVYNSGLRTFTIVTIALLTVQLIYGAFMAGLKAAMAAATWPTINGMWVPESMADKSWTSYPLNVHFFHRTLAYILTLLIIIWFVKARKMWINSYFKKASIWPLILVVLQVVLGIITVLSAPQIVFGKFGVYEILAEAHQLVAMCLLAALVINLYLIRSRKYS
jgi:cytochrome c oxidase assembly protein subunit 15